MIGVRSRGFALLVLLWGSISSVAQAQPSTVGAWSTAVNLNALETVHFTQTVGCGPGAPASPPPACDPSLPHSQLYRCEEIAHAALIPVGPKAGWVVFWRSHISVDDVNVPAQEVYVWQPDGPVVYKMCVQDVVGTLQDPRGEVFCGGHTFMADGSLLTSGAGYYPATLPGLPPGPPFPTGCSGMACDQNIVGSREAWRFDPWILNDPSPAFPPGWAAFERLADMNKERWYASALLRPDKKVMIAGGLARTCFAVPGGGCLALGCQAFPDDVELFDLQVGGTWTSGPAGLAPSFNCNSLPIWTTYPLLQLITNFPSSPAPGLPSADMVLLGFDGPLANVQNTWIVSATTASDTDDLVASQYRRSEGNGIRVPHQDPTFTTPDRFLILGGRDGFTTSDAGIDQVEHLVNPQALTSTWLEDTAAVPPAGAWSPLTFGRVYSNTVILPDASLLVVGGANRDYVFTGVPPLERRFPELLSTDNPTGWQLMAEQPHRRLYHSVALLLRDGRVLSMGGQYWNTSVSPPDPTDPLFGRTFESDAQIYSPPYLFKGPRPEIRRWDSAISYGLAWNVTVRYRSGTLVDRMVLMRPSSVTHGTDFDQRHVPLAFSAAGPPTTLPNGWLQQDFQFTAPPHEWAAPPGYYMLFVLTAQAPPHVDLVPSVAEFVFLD